MFTSAPKSICRVEFHMQSTELFSFYFHFTLLQRSGGEHQAGKLEGVENGKFTYYYSGGKQFYRR